MRRLVQATLLAALPLALSLGLTGSAPAQSRAPQASTIMTGDWQYSYRLGGFLPAGRENKCLGRAEVRRFAEGICTSRYRCEYDVKNVSNGKVELKGVWIDKKGRAAPVTANGTYGPESFTLNIHLKTTNGLPIAGTMNAKRIGSTCTPDAE